MQGTSSLFITDPLDELNPKKIQLFVDAGGF